MSSACLLVKAPKGAKYDSQGQARSASPLDQAHQKGVEPCKGRNTIASISAFQASTRFFGYLTRGDALRCASRLPLAFIFRAFGAVTFDSTSRAFGADGH
jgi:hypothetical protein